MGKKMGPEPRLLNQAVSETLSAELARLGISSLAFAAKCGIKRSSLARLLKGELVWDIAELELVAAALGWSVIDILQQADPDGTLSDFRPRQELPSGPRLVVVPELPSFSRHADLERERRVADSSPDEDAATTDHDFDA